MRFCGQVVLNRVLCRYVHVPAEVAFYVQFLVKFATTVVLLQSLTELSPTKFY